MPSLSALLSTFDPSAGIELPPQWLQGRTGYGGITTALGVVAAKAACAPALPPLRSVQVNFVGPASGHLSFEVQLLRAGKSVTAVAVDVHGENGLALRLTLVFAQPRQSVLAHSLVRAPQVPGWQDCAALDMAHVPFAPAFIANFELRPAGGAMPMAGAEHPELLFWVRHGEAAGVDPALALVAMADALPPAVFSALRTPAPASSVNWSFDLLDPAPKGQWFLLRSVSQYASEGYSAQAMQVWDEQGQLVMLGRQCVAVFA